MIGFQLRKAPLLYHIFCWAALYVLWIAVFQNRSFALTRTLTVQFCYLIFIALNYYILIYFLVPRVLHKKGIGFFILCDLALLLVSAYLRARLAIFMSANVFLVGKPQPAFWGVLEASVLNIAIWMHLLFGARLLWDRIQNQRQMATIEHEKILNELSFLKAQINPHFLFNSMNSLYGHIDRNNKTARNILLKLSEILRYQLYECNVERIIMPKEMDYIRNYVSLQQYRKEEDLQVCLEMDENLSDLTIAPLILTVFIENAFKHISSYEDKANMIHISLKRVQNLLHFEISNTWEEQKKQNELSGNNGIGIRNVKRRLQLLYPDKHELSINQFPDMYEIDLKMELA
jgi:two-component system LytT family sensor kinase